MGKLMDIFESSNIHPAWRGFLETDFDCMLALSGLDVAYTNSVNAGTTVFPAPADIFKVFEHDPFRIRCLILGQDPYHEVGEAMGLAFSVPNGTKCPPSLRNIKKEIAADIGNIELSGTDLTPWAEQGVFLLNTVLTVEEGKANSHAKLGWEIITHRAVNYMVRCGESPIAAILWGAQAKKEEAEIMGWQSLRPIKVITSAHPSPLSANRGFFGSRPFSQVNEFLKKYGELPIDWSIPATK